VEHATLTKAAKDAASIDLTAVLVAVTDEEPRVLTIKDGKALPSGPFASSHRSLQTGVRSWVERQTHHPLGYLEQLYPSFLRTTTKRPRSSTASPISSATAWHWRARRRKWMPR
jgi:hypothetical protein